MTAKKFGTVITVERKKTSVFGKPNEPTIWQQIRLW
jgi:hypothetical protein